MSGGHWDYMQRRFEEAADGAGLVPESLRLLGQIEHELDWGHACDTCIACARLRVVAALDVFFDAGGSSTTAIAVLRDHEALSNYCDRCLREMPNWRPASSSERLAAREREISKRAVERAR